MSSSGPVGIGVETPARANQLRYKQATTVAAGKRADEPRGTRAAQGEYLTVLGVATPMVQ